MPELPDVETYRRYLEATALRQKIRKVTVESPSILEGTSPQGLGRMLKGRCFDLSRRHGKYLFTRWADDSWLAMHFGMTGFLAYLPDGEATPAHTRCLFQFQNGSSLAYVSPRKLGRLLPVDSVDAFIGEKQLGPDVLSLEWSVFRQLAEQHRGGVKAWLMDQQVMSGLGNVYSDEVLFRARIDPRRQVQTLDRDELRKLHRATGRVLGSAIEAEADPKRMPRSFLLPRRERGARCPRCDSEVKRLKVAGRSAWICPACQH